MSVDDVCECILHSIDDISDDYRQVYASSLKEKNLCGKVLALCDLNELKNEMRMTFGDWLLFKQWILLKRTTNNNYPKQPNQQQQHSPLTLLNSDTPKSRSNSKIDVPHLNLKQHQQTIEYLATTTDTNNNIKSLSTTSSVKTTPPAVVVTTGGGGGSSAGSGRKVEFFISPVTEVDHVAAMMVTSQRQTTPTPEIKIESVDPMKKQAVDAASFERQMMGDEEESEGNDESGSSEEDEAEEENQEGEEDQALLALTKQGIIGN